MKPRSDQQPIVGGVYLDKSGSSLVVLNIVGDRVLLEYASGTITSIDARNWQQLEPQVAVF
jgi:hypothetical protein